MSSKKRRRLLKTLGEKLGAPVVAAASAWRDPRTTDLDGLAARELVELLDETGSGPVVLLLAARGGTAEFTDAVWRAVKVRGYDVLVPTLVTGAASALALGANRILLGAHGALGAANTGPLLTSRTRLEADLMDDVPALGGIHYSESDPTLPARLAAGAAERRLARSLVHRIVADEARADRLLEALDTARLGHATGLSGPELAALGCAVHAVEEPELWAYYEELEQELGVRAPPPVMYTESDLGDEVEFLPAIAIAGAVVESRSATAQLGLDTGSPDPDTGRLRGSWATEG